MHMNKPIRFLVDTKSKPPWAKRTKPLVNPGASDLVTLAQSVAFIVERLNPPQAKLRLVDDSVRHRVEYALKHGQLLSDATGKILFGDLVKWGRSKRGWSAAFDLLPSLNRAVGSASIGALFGTASGHAVPATAAAKDDALREAYVRIHELEAIVKAQSDELASLRPIGAAKRLRSAAASAAGKKGGRPRKS